MTNQRVEIITSVQRRRRWSAAEKEELVRASSVSRVARQAGIHPGQLYGWRRRLRAQAQMRFAPVRIAAEAAPAGLAGSGTIEIEFATGARMRIMGAVDVTAPMVGGDDPGSFAGEGADRDRPYRHASRA